MRKIVDVIALERDQQSTNDIESRTTRLRILKSRYTGDVGLANSLLYDVETGRLSEYFDKELEILKEDTPF